MTFESVCLTISWIQQASTVQKRETHSSRLLELLLNSILVVMQQVARVESLPAPDGPTRASISPGTTVPPLLRSTGFCLCVAVSSTEHDSSAHARSQGALSVLTPIFRAELTMECASGWTQRFLWLHEVCTNPTFHSDRLLPTWRSGLYWLCKCCSCQL